jgi:REP element-mobilizing transposase RayT
MGGTTFGKNISVAENKRGHQYDWQHMIFVTKYRYKMFRNPDTRQIIKDAIYFEAEKYGIAIKEFAFGDDYAHVHMEITVPDTLSVSQVAQFLK